MRMSPENYKDGVYQGGRLDDGGNLRWEGTSYFVKSPSYDGWFFRIKDTSNRGDFRGILRVNGYYREGRCRFRVPGEFLE